MNGEAVKVDKLTKSFGDFTAVNGISFSVREGEIFGFLGPNGAGKSTTIKMLCGILAPTSGSGTVAGHDITDSQENIKRSIGYMSQRFSLYDDLTVYENLEFFGSIYGLDKKKLRMSMDRVMDMAGIKGRGGIMVKTLPGGILQRLALGCAVLHDPGILFLDEPTSGVDPLMRRNFWDTIYRFSREGKTIFVTTHYLDEAEHCDRISLIIDGKIIALDTPENLKAGLSRDVYSLEVDDFIKVFEIISAAPFVKECAIFGSNIHIICEKDMKMAKEIRSFLKNAGVVLSKLDKIDPTLEDVFVTRAREHGL